MIDALAEVAGMDPVAFRIHNEAQSLRRAEWELGAERFGWTDKWRPSDRTDAKARMRRGAGVASAFWGQMGSTGQNGRGPRFAVTCKIHQDGSVESRSGAQDIGTGMKTVLATLTGEELQLEPGRVRVTMGCTDDPFGPGSGGSTTTPSLAPAARLAAGRAKQALAELVADHLGVEPKDVVVRNGQWGVDGGRMLSFADACKLIGAGPIVETGERLDNYEGYQNNVCGCQFAEVEVDTHTGNVRVLEMLAVQDCGLVIAKKLAENQVLGAMVGALSYALHERRILDPTQGRMLNGDMLQYKIAGLEDMPEMTAIMFPVANGKNNVGAAGLGEPPAVAGAAAIANAVANAIGAPVRRLPIMPDVVLTALAARNGGDKR
jgi:xanthine dehydrogenase YagR molybdenum-binding subunit